MSFVKPRGSAETDKPADFEFEGNIRELVRRDVTALRQNDSADSETAGHSLNSLLRRVSGTSTRELDNLVGELQTLREKLQEDGNRIQREIMEYATLSQSVMQLTKIISESVKKLPDNARVGASG
jgi:hypothetical protein